MTKAFEKRFRRLLGAPAADRGACATALLAEDPPWETWADVFNQAHVSVPEQEARAGAALAAAAGRRRLADLAARFRLFEGRALQRAGSPAAAALVLGRAGVALRAVGDEDRALGADILRVDALAVAGRVDEALELADAAKGRLKGPRAPLWNAVLSINRANALRLRGDLSEAVRTYDRAARTLERLGDLHTAAIARTNAGTVLMDLGAGAAACERFRSTLAFFEAQGQTDPAAEVQANLAAAYTRAGRLGDAIRELERLARAHGKRGLNRREALCRMDLSDALLRAGDSTAAAREAGSAAEKFGRAGARAERVEALWLEAAADPANARRNLRRARDAAKRAGRPVFELRCDLLAADLTLRQGRHVSSDTLRGLLRRAEKLGQDEIAAQVHLLRGHAALSEGRHLDAGRHFAAPVLRKPGHPWLRAAADAGRARADGARGRRTQALRRLEGVCAFLDEVRADLPGAWLRATFLLDRLDPHLTRVDLLLERGTKADRRAAAAVLDSLALRRFLGSRPPRMPKRLERERERLALIHDRLARGAGPTRGLDPRTSLDLEREARRLERRVAESWRRAERSTVGAAPPRAPRRLGREGCTIVHVWVRDGRVRGLITVGGVSLPPADLGPIGALEDDLEMLAFHDARALRSPRGAAAVSRTLEALSSRVLDPLDVGSWRGRALLVIDPGVPDIPWEMLPVRERNLGARVEMVRVPAASASSPRRVAGRGTTVVALGESDLPGSRREARGIGRHGALRAGADATKDAVAEALARRSVVHLTGHGFHAADAPGLGGVRVADGWFGSPDVPDVVAANLVILAACRTGRTDGTAGLAWGGLPTALLGAGANYVLWTSRDVDDGKTADLMERLHGFLRRMSVPAALGLALEAVAADQGHAAGFLDFRLSGMPR